MHRDSVLAFFEPYPASNIVIHRGAQVRFKDRIYVRLFIGIYEETLSLSNPRRTCILTATQHGPLLPDIVLRSVRSAPGLHGGCVAHGLSQRESTYDFTSSYIDYRFVSVTRSLPRLNTVAPPAPLLSLFMVTVVEAWLRNAVSPQANYFLQLPAFSLLNSAIRKLCGLFPAKCCQRICSAKQRRCL